MLNAVGDKDMLFKSYFFVSTINAVTENSLGAPIMK
jgi:hypothetical protein